MGEEVVIWVPWGVGGGGGGGGRFDQGTSVEPLYKYGGYICQFKHCF